MRIRCSALATVLLTTGLIVLGTAVPAAAHGDTIEFRIEKSGGGDGHVRAVATYENDKDPVTEKIAGTLSAVSAEGRTAGPWVLVAVPGAEATYSTREALPPGRWKITVESGLPDLGHGEGRVTVTPGTHRPSPSGDDDPSSKAVPQSAKDRTPAAGHEPSPHHRADAGDGSHPTWWTAVCAGVGGALGATAIWWRKRRRDGAR